VRQESLDQATFPEVYVHYRQLMAAMESVPDLRRSQDAWAIGFLSFAIRTEEAPASLVPAIQRLVGTVDPALGIDALLPMSRLVASSVARERFFAIVLGAFAALAAVLAAIGIYGVRAYVVAQRTREIGIRMALGAERTHVVALILRGGLALTVVGIALGLGAAAAASRLLQGMLFGITPLDLPTFGAVAVGFGLVTTVASYVPARRATRIDPNVALRAD
jgi:ABC-type antimicrobial peptide transport system permease subunit